MNQTPSPLNKRIDIREFARELSRRHNIRGAAALCLDKGYSDAFFAASCGLQLVDRTEEGKTYKVGGPILNPKQVRKFLWESRNDPRVSSFTSVIWTVYDTDSRTTHIGYGEVKPPDKEPVNA